MAAGEFDFDAFSTGKFNDYKKVTLKDQVLGKSSSCLILTMIDVGTQKKIGVLIPFLKEAGAKAAFETWKAIKPGKSKIKKATCKAAVAKMATTKGDNGLDVTLTITKGFKNPKKIETALAPLFVILNKKLTIVGGSVDESTSGTPESSTDGSTTETTVDPAKKAKRVEKRAKILEGIGKMKKAKAQGKISIKQINAQIEKYDAILANLMIEAEEDGTIDESEKEGIEAVVKAIEGLKKDLKNAVDKKTRKLTTKERETIVSNMDKMDKKLQQILAKLG